MDEQSVNGQVANPQNPVADEKPSNREENLRNLVKKAERAEMERDQERAEKAQLLQRMQELEARMNQSNSSDDLELEDEGYIETRKLKKVLARFEQKIDQKMDQKTEQNARRLLDEERQRSSIYHLKTEYRDFDQVMTEDTVNRFAEKHPGMANTIMKIPDEYERKKMAYEAIKTLGLHEKKSETPIQERVDRNQKNLYFTPSGVGTSSHPAGDFSKSGQKAAYEKMKSLARAPLSG